jgi:carbonic anhydrase
LVDGPNVDQYEEKKAVVAVLFQIGDTNHHTMEHLKTEKLDTIDEADLGEIFREAENKSFYHYKGTLTVPIFVLIYQISNFF